MYQYRLWMTPTFDRVVTQDGVRNGRNERPHVFALVDACAMLSGNSVAAIFGAMPLNLWMLILLIELDDA